MEHAAPSDPAKFPFVLVGNKTDTARVVSEADAKSWCAQNGNCPYFETCATKGENVETAFRKCAELAAAQMGSSGFDMGMPTSLGGA